MSNSQYTSSSGHRPHEENGDRVAVLDSPAGNRSKRTHEANDDSRGSHHLTSHAGRKYAADATLCLPLRQTGTGIKKLLGSAVLFAVGGFLLSHVFSTPALQNQLALLGVIGIGAGIALVWSAIGNLTSSLVLDKQGISIHPRLPGFAIDWCDLKSWRMTDEKAFPTGPHQLVVRSAKRDVPQIVSIDMLDGNQRAELRDTLKTWGCEAAR